MIVSLNDEELSAIVVALTTADVPAWARNHDRYYELISKLVDAKTRYDRMMAESTPLLLVARLEKNPCG